MSASNKSNEPNPQLSQNHDNRNLTQEQKNESQQNDQNQTSEESESAEISSQQIVDGAIYLNLLDTKDISKVLPIIRNLNLRDDDVIMPGFPKSGNHWIFEIINMILQQNATFSDALLTGTFIEGQDEDVQKILDEVAAPRVLTSHLRSNRLPKQAVEKKVKIVYPLRNPKDVAVSMYIMVTAVLLDELKCKATFSKFFETFISGKFAWGDWFAHVLAMEKFMKENPEHPVFIASFERMKTSPREVIKELCAFLGKPDAIAEEIAKATEMSNMKKIMIEGKEGEFLKDKMNPESLFRKGIIGDWKHRLTVGQSEAIDEVFKQKMAGSELARLVKDYM